MITYVLTLSKIYPSYHPRAGELTRFADKLYHKHKIHTIRENYRLWQKRFEKINAGEACLSIRQWVGKPYRSKQVELVCLTKEDEIGLQGLQFFKSEDLFDGHAITGRIVPIPPPLKVLAQNDGLTLQDWKDWFGKSNLTKPVAIIHFTKFRY